MAAFKSHRLFAFAPADLTPVARDVAEHFQGQDYEVTSEKTITNGYDISITKGGAFKSVLGLKTALKVDIEPANGMTKAQAGVGIFGLQAVPTAITLLLFWPVIITQIWGMVQSSKLDEEAMEVIEASLQAHARATVATAPPASAPGEGAAPTAPGTHAFCTECGASLPAEARFCPSCGTKVA
jgi:hypothetical protein